MLIAAGIVAVYHRTFPSRQTVSHQKMQFCNIFILALLIVAGFVGYARMQSDVHTKNGLHARLQGDWDRVISEMDQAYSSFYSLDPTATPLMWYRGMAYYELGMLEKARIDFSRAYGDHPNHVHVLNNLATCHALLLDTQSALRYYNRMLETFPRFESGIVNLCALYVAEGNYKAANDVLQRFAQENAGDGAAAVVRQVRSRLEDS
jgi:lipoprotein NlpI